MAAAIVGVKIGRINILPRRVGKRKAFILALALWAVLLLVVPFIPAGAYTLTALLAVATVAGVLLGRHLNVLARGAAQAASVGMDVRRLQVLLFVGSSVLTGCAVSAAGSIGFVGLVTPHIARLALGSDNRVVLPAAALLGGALLMAADLAARVLIAPRQLPVGALTALVGVPLFLLLMARRQP
mgnify:CR=1 FL=1